MSRAPDGRPTVATGCAHAMLPGKPEEKEGREAMSIIARRSFIRNAVGTALALGGGLPGARFAHAQDSAFPSRPLRFIVPLAAGGGIDFVARVVGDHMSRDRPAGGRREPHRRRRHHRHRRGDQEPAGRLHGPHHQ